MTSMFERLVGTPCAMCRHMSWDLFYDEPGGACTVQARNRYGAWRPASALCVKHGFDRFEQEDWKADKAKAWAKAKAECGMRNLENKTAVTFPKQPFRSCESFFK